MGTLVQLHPRSTPRAVEAAARPDDEPEYFWVPMLVLWLGSIARVSLTLVHRARFETEATLALACVIVLPLGLLANRLRERERARRLRRVNRVGCRPFISRAR